MEFYVILCTAYFLLHSYFYLCNQELLDREGNQVDPAVDCIVVSSNDPGLRDPEKDHLNLQIVNLRFPFFSFGIFLRSVLVLVFFPAALMGRPLVESQLLVSLSLILLIEPVTLPLPRLEESNPRAPFLVYAVMWAASEFRRYLTLGICSLPFLALYMAGRYFFDFDLLWLGLSRDLIEFGSSHRIGNSLDVPPIFYFGWLLMLTWRCAGAAIALGGRVNGSLVFFWATLSGAFSLTTFYFLTGQVSLTLDNWDAPLDGFLAAQIFKFSWDWLWSRIDRTRVPRDKKEFQTVQS